MYLSLLDLMRRQIGLPVSPEPLLMPDWRDDGDHLVLRLPLAGLDPKSIQLQVSETALTVAGSRSHEERVEGPGFYRASLAQGIFAQTLPLPVPVLPRESRATWQGEELLEVRLHKA